MRKVIVVVCLLVSASAQAQVFKCTTNGEVTYQDRPCEGDEQAVMNIDTTREVDVFKRKAHELHRRLGRRDLDDKDVPPTNISDRWIEQATAAVAQRMRDPGSVQFRDITHRSLNGVDDYVVCGEVNAKNGFGAYAGFTRFIVIAGEPPMMKDKDPFQEFFWQYFTACTGATPPRD